MAVELRAGIFLLAGPSLGDPNFRRTAVLLCDHGAEGSLGLVVNRPLKAPLGKVFSSLPAGIAGTRDFRYGGPVEHGRVMALRRGPHEGESLHPVCEGVQMVGDIEAAVDRLGDGLASPEDYLFFLGYAGWGKGQLEGELEASAWITRPASEQLIFDTTPAQIWSHALRELGGIYRLYAEMPMDPSLN